MKWAVNYPNKYMLTSLIKKRVFMSVFVFTVAIGYHRVFKYRQNLSRG